MATWRRLIDANALKGIFDKRYDVAFTQERTRANAAWWDGYATGVNWGRNTITDIPTVDAVELPCKIGDWVWAIRSYHGHKHPQRGIVSEMYFSQDMGLHIVVKHIARGEWGKTVFATDKEAYAAIEGRSSNDCD